jgi:hypothetical protein
MPKQESEEQRERKRAYQASYRLANKDKHRQQAANWRAANREKVAASNAAWKIANPHAVKEAHLRSNYGLTLAGYDTMYSACGGLCEICNEPMSHLLSDAPSSAKACVDHCHSTGKVRGLLCHRCNKSLAFLETFGKSATTYLERTKMKSANEETQKQEQPVLQGSHPSEALAGRMAEPVVGEDFPLGSAYCGTDGTCESCQ